MQLTIEFKRGESGYVVATCPQFEGCVGQGKDRNEALESIIDGILGVMQYRLKEAHQQLPPNGSRAVEIDLLTATDLDARCSRSSRRPSSSGLCAGSVISIASTRDRR